jgi:hypothetical protein
MADQDETPTLKDDFWSALSLELALHGLHPGLDSKALRAVMQHRALGGRRSRIWLPLDVGKRLAALRFNRLARRFRIGLDIPEDDDQ